MPTPVDITQQMQRAIEQCKRSGNGGPQSKIITEGGCTVQIVTRQRSGGDIIQNVLINGYTNLHDNPPAEADAIVVRVPSKNNLNRGQTSSASRTGKENINPASGKDHNKPQKNVVNGITASTQAAGQKRKSDADSIEEEELKPIDAVLESPQLCDELRKRVREFLAQEKLPEDEFCKVSNTTEDKFSPFLDGNGLPRGKAVLGCIGVWLFFKKRECEGDDPSKKRKLEQAVIASIAVGVPLEHKLQKAEKAASRVAAKAAARAESGAPAPASNAPTTNDASAITLDGEFEDQVPILESCDQVRYKITAHLSKGGVTQAQFCRDMQAQMHTAAAPTKIQSKMLADFRKKKGATAGNSSSVYYAAYVFFEKQRIQEGKPKSKHRVEFEKNWPHGADRELARGGLWCGPNERPYEDQFGRISFR